MRRGAGGLGWNLFSAALPLVGSFLVSVLLAPYVGDEAWGEYSLVMSVATLMLVVAKFGIHSAASRLVSENEEQPGPWIRAALLWRAIFTVGVALIALVLSEPVARSFGREASAGFWLVAPVVVAVSFFELGTELLVGLRSFRAQLAARLGYLALRLAAIGVVRWQSLGIFAFLVGHSLSQAIPALLVLGGLWWRTRTQDSPEARTTRKRTLELALPLAFGSASFLVYAHTDRLMLGWFHDLSAVGQFTVARNVLDAALFPLVALTWSLRPALVRALGGRGEQSTAEVLSHGLAVSVFFALTLPAVTFTLGTPLLRAIYGPGFAEASDLLRWMTPLLLLRGVGAVIFPALVAADRQSAYARLMAFTAVANVVSNLALIPPLGARGAILGTLVALLVLTVGGWREIRAQIGPIPWASRRADHAVSLGLAAGLAASLSLWGADGRGSLGLAVATALSTAAMLAGFLWIERRGRGRDASPESGGA